MRMLRTTVAALGIVMFTNIVTNAVYATDIDALKSAVVTIKNKSGLTGTGFVAHLSRDTAYIVTAYHVIEGDNHPLVTFYSRQDRPVRASTVSAFQMQNIAKEDRGLAIITVGRKGSIPDGVKAITIDPSIRLKGGERIQSIGYISPSEAWSVIAGSILCVKNLDIEIQMDPAVEGCSGAPVLVGDVVIGLITAKGPTHVAAIPSAIVWFYLSHTIHGAIGDAYNKASPAATARKLLREEYGLEVNSNSFMEAVKTGDIPVVQLSLMANPNLVTSIFPVEGMSRSTEVNINGPTTTSSATFTAGMTALVLASSYGHVEVVRDLLLAGADVNGKSTPPAEVTPLACAAAGGYMDIMDLLLKSGAKTEIPLAAGYTALLFAVNNGSVAGVSALLKAGANVNAKADDDYTALMLVEDEQTEMPSAARLEIRKLLIKAGAK